MRLLFLIFFLFNSKFYFCQNRIYSKIDSLETEQQVQNFVRTSIKKDSAFAKFELRKISDFNTHTVSDLIKKTADSLKINKNFYKGDFDNNGFTDLIIIGDDGSCSGMKPLENGGYESYSCDFSVLCILDLGDRFMVKNLQQNHQDEVIPYISKINNRDYIKVFYEESNFDSFGFMNKISSKILSFKFDDFIEYNPNVKHLDVQRIIFETSGCFGTCPIFKLEISKFGNAKFIAESYNFSERYSRKPEGTFITFLNFISLQELFGILDYISFSDLKNDYAVHWTDDQTSTLTIIYDDGKIKSIRDYGLVGTYGLKLLYKKLFDLRFNQNWKKMK